MNKKILTAAIGAALVAGPRKKGMAKEGVTASVEKLDSALRRAESNLEKAQRQVEDAVDEKLKEIAKERGAVYVKEKEKDKKGKKK